MCSRRVPKTFLGQADCLLQGGLAKTKAMGPKWTRLCDAHVTKPRPNYV